MAVGTDVYFVLVRPKRAQNVAAACRAIKNMGFARLCLVDAPADLEAERRAAYGAWDVFDAIERAPSLGEAVAGCTVVAATSGRATRDVLTPRRFAETLDDAASGGRAAVVFGPEDNGLSVHERALCHVTVRIPSAPAQPSLNLAQAVLVLAYELAAAAPGTTTPERERATAAEFEAAIDALREALLAIGYLNPQNPEAVMGELRALLWRGAPTQRDLTLLRGLARQVAWRASVGPGGADA